MTNSALESPNAFDPGSMSNNSLANVKAVWYRRPWFLATIGIVVVVAVSIITDLPHPVSRAEDVSQQNAVIQQINNDAAPCVFAVQEGFKFYRDGVAHPYTGSELKVVSNYLLGDQTACSFASGPVYDMVNNIQPIDTAAGKYVDSAMAATVKWITYDAVAALLDLRNYFAKSPFTLNATDLKNREAALATERQTVLNDIASAGNLLHTTLKPITLPQLAALPGA